MSLRFLMTGGGTGGHVFPALAVAAVLRQRGHTIRFLGTAEGLEAKLVPQAGFEIDFIRIGGLNRVGVVRQLRTLMQLPVSVFSAVGVLRKQKPAAVFSMGGYVAGPVMLAALLCRVPLVVMEPNAMPGFANRTVARYVYKALVGFSSTARWFPKDRTEITGLPVRQEFFDIAERAAQAESGGEKGKKPLPGSGAESYGHGSEAPVFVSTELPIPDGEDPGRGRPFSAGAEGGMFTVLITGGSRGARTLNRASRESWALFRDHQTPLRLIHQTGAAEHEHLAKEFDASGLQGEVVAFISDMASTFARTDLIVGRAGAGAVAEIAAAGLPSVLVPLPFAANDHQRKNAEALAEAGAARIVLDKELTGERLFHEVEELRNQPQRLAEMRREARRFAKPGAADRAADVLEEAGTEKNARLGAK
ncbi:MAG: undecaprenyldiphospho-muramoylpentapeptide beta-N-acetylglucosaminyltransferase [Bryobacteraceae bacterium]